MEQNYIVGYGSLLSKESRARTGISGDALPVRINGISRGWNLAAPDYHMTAVGVMVDQGSYINANMFPVLENELENFDSREIGYDRTKVNVDDIAMLLGGAVPYGNFWMYTGQKSSKPSISSPIAQSYIDVILDACLRGYNEDFAREFIKTTQLWEYPWVDDRNKPRYPRAIHLKPDIRRRINKMLEEEVTEEFHKRR